MADELKTIEVISDLPPEIEKELDRALTQDILERYDNEDYYDKSFIIDFLHDKGYKFTK